MVKNILEDSFESFRVNKSNYKINTSAGCEILANKESLKIVFDNLTDNAVKYSVGNLLIEVNVSRNSNKLLIDFADNGIGINPKEKKKIFRQFYRIDNKEIPNVKGTGLGLYQVKQIIKNHNGKISVLSKEEKPGAVFRIELPVYKGIKKK